MACVCVFSINPTKKKSKRDKLSCGVTSLLSKLDKLPSLPTTTMSLLEKIMSQEEYDKQDVAPAADMNLGSHFLCMSCTYCRCCPTVSLQNEKVRKNAFFLAFFFQGIAAFCFGWVEAICSFRYDATVSTVFQREIADTHSQSGLG